MEQMKNDPKLKRLSPICYKFSESQKLFFKKWQKFPQKTFKKLPWTPYQLRKQANIKYKISFNETHEF